MGYIRLDKYLADSGKGTRSEVKNLIKKKRVRINGDVALKPEQKVDTEADIVLVDDRAVSFEEFQYYMLHKPAGVVSATTDKRDKTVIDLIKEDKRRDLFPVGRLDKDTEGLLLITNDGQLSNSLMAPGKHIDKTYIAAIAGRVDASVIEHFREGIDIGDDKPTRPAALRLLTEDELMQNSFSVDEVASYVEIVITEGRYHQIKRMFQAEGMEVIYLKRVAVGSLFLDPSLEKGAYRKLTADELLLLRNRQD